MNTEMTDNNGHEKDLSLELLPDNPCDTCENCGTCEAPAIATCQSCGMPMMNAGEHGGGDEENIYCIHCCHPDGSLKDYDEVFKGMVSLMMTNRGMGKEEAEKAAGDYLAIMPAWNGR